MLHFEDVAPSSPLREYIECYWILKSESSLHDEICLPDGSANFIFNFGNPIFRAYCHRPEETQQMGLSNLLHQGKTSTIVHHEGALDVVGVRFKPHGLAPFFGMSMTEFCPPFALNGNTLCHLVGTLGEELAAHRSQQKRVELLNKKFLAMLPKAEVVDPLVNKAVAEMVRSSGNLRIGELHEQLCVSKSTLEKKFQEHVGLSPKILCNILRFNSIVYQAQQTPTPSLTQLTYEQGFFDQSHLVHNFRSFTGLPPGRFFRQENRLVEILRQSFESRTEIY